MSNPEYPIVTTQYFKTNFARLVRDVQFSDTKKGIKVTSHGRLLGIFVVNK